MKPDVLKVAEVIFDKLTDDLSPIQHNALSSIMIVLLFCLVNTCVQSFINVGCRRANFEGSAAHVDSSHPSEALLKANLDVENAAIEEVILNRGRQAESVRQADSVRQARDLASKCATDLVLHNQEQQQKKFVSNEQPMNDMRKTLIRSQTEGRKERPSFLRSQTSAKLLAASTTCFELLIKFFDDAAKAMTDWQTLVKLLVLHADVITDILVAWQLIALGSVIGIVCGSLVAYVVAQQYYRMQVTLHDYTTLDAQARHGDLEPFAVKYYDWLYERYCGLVAVLVLDWLAFLSLPIDKCLPFAWRDIKFFSDAQAKDWTRLGEEEQLDTMQKAWRELRLKFLLQYIDVRVFFVAVYESCPLAVFQLPLYIFSSKLQLTQVQGEHHPSPHAHHTSCLVPLQRQLA